MNKIKIELEQFFALLRGGLWVEYQPNPELFVSMVNWDELYTLACQQTVSALVWDGIQKLPSELFPPVKLRMQWLGRTVRIERTNRLMDEILSEIVSIYKEKGLHPILLKGQALAANYPNPLHRECGDIDLLFFENEYERAKEIGQELNTGRSHESMKHYCFSYKGISIENHRYLISLYDSQHQKELDSAVRSLKDQTLPFHLLPCGTVDVLPHTLNVHFVFLHLYHHFMVCGLGFRQICDWTLMSDKDPIQQYIGYKPLIYWQLFGDVAVQHLGLNPEKIVQYRTFSRRTVWLTQQLITDGNFGKNSQTLQSIRNKGFFTRKINSFYQKLFRYPRFIALAPTRSIFIILQYVARTSIVALQRKHH